MSLKELQELQARVADQIPQAKARELKNLRGEVDKLAAQHGFAAAEILTPSGRMRRTGGSKPTHRDPETGRTWAGKGRPPKWLDRAVAI